MFPSAHVNSQIATLDAAVRPQTGLISVPRRPLTVSEGSWDQEHETDKRSLGPLPLAHGSQWPKLSCSTKKTQVQGGDKRKKGRGKVWVSHCTSQEAPERGHRGTPSTDGEGEAFLTSNSLPLLWLQCKRRGDCPPADHNTRGRTPPGGPTPGRNEVHTIVEMGAAGPGCK